MPFHITCDCGRLTIAPDSAAGQTIVCSRCNRELSVPSVESVAPPPPPESISAPQTAGTDEAEWDEPRIIVDVAQPAYRRRTLPREVQAAYWLAAALFTLAIVSLVPLIVAHMPRPAEEPVAGMERWELVVVLAAILHLVYLVYLLQLPDRSCIWVVSLFLLAIATLYATLLGIRWLSPSANPIMQMLDLDGNRFSSSQEVGWCFLMTLLTGLTSYLSGRTASQLRTRSLEREDQT